MIRLTVCCTVLLCALPVAMAAPDSVVTFTEIHYHPPDPVPPAAREPEWIEIHNEMSIRVDISGWTLRGEIDYTFPEGTVMEPGAYLVVSELPGSPPGSLGPWNGRLDNKGGEIRLHERWGRMMDVVDYGDSDPWPEEPDGLGCTLAKRRPELLSDSAASWAASGEPGGTPGAENFPVPVETSPRFASFAETSWTYTLTSPPDDWREADFHDSAWLSGNAPFGSDASQQPGTLLPLDTETVRLRKEFAYSGGIGHVAVLLTGSLRGLATVSLNGGAIRECAADGEFAVTLVPEGEGLRVGANVISVELRPSAAGGAVLLDAAVILLDRATGIDPADPPHQAGPVVINEIFYHARPVYPDHEAGIRWAANNLEWLELHNPGDTEVALDGWRLTSGIDYTLPPGTRIAPGGYLVITNQQFSGSLSNSSDTIRLRDASGAIIDEVTYFDSGRWPAAADGGGSSLELIDPLADNRRPESWAASDESTRSTWHTVTYRARGAEPPGTNYPSNWREFLLGFLDAGEALIDDVSVIEDPDGAAIQLIRNGTFDADTPGGGAAHWRLLGTHRLSRVVKNPDGPGNVLHLIATAEHEHTTNNASTTVAGNRPFQASKTYEISFRARWISGSPQLNSRLYLNRAARTTILPQPDTAGTPGAPNSRRVPAAGPTYRQLRHSPLVPAAGQPVRVSVSASDPRGIREMQLVYSVNGGDRKSVPMGPDGTGLWFGVIPGANTNAIVHFYIQAVNAAGVSSFFPRGGPESRALYRVGDGGVSSQPVRNRMRLYMTQADAAALHSPTATVSNYRWPCTVIYNDREVWYDAGVRLRSAPYGRQGTRTGWSIRFGSDAPFRGIQKTVAIDGAFNMPRGDGNGWQENSLGACVTEMLYHAIARRAGAIPCSYDDIVYFQTPRAAEGNRRAQLKMTRFGSGYLEEEFRDGADGMLFKQELIYYPTGTIDGKPESLKLPYSSVLDTEIRSFGPSPDSYRFNYLPENNRDRDDFSALIRLGAAFDSPAASLFAATSAVIDRDQWMRVYALTALTGLADTYNSGLAHNIELYVRPDDGKVLLFPWDQDHAFYYSPTSGIYGGETHRLAGIIAIPANRRLFASHLYDLCQTAFTNEHLDPVIGHLFEVAGRPQYAADIRSWVSRRRTYVLNRLNAQFPSTTFRITSNEGADISVSAPHYTLEGRGGIEVRGILLSHNGSPPEPVEVTWLDSQRWTIPVPLQRGANNLQLTAVTRPGSPAGTAAITITNSGGVESAGAASLTITEIHYRADREEEQFIELMNTGAVPVDLTGVRFAGGILFEFTGAGVVLLAPGQRVLVVADRAAFEARYGSGLPVAGEWSPLTRLGLRGDRLRLVDRAGRVLDEFSYDDRLPWPEDPAAQFSLTRILPVAGPSGSPASWRPSTRPEGSPGTSDSLAPGSFPDLLSYALVDGPRTGTGDVPSFSWTERLGADAVRIIPEVSGDLRVWTPDTGSDPLFESRAESIRPGSRTVTVVPSPSVRYLRIRVISR